MYCNPRGGGGTANTIHSFQNHLSQGGQKSYLYPDETAAEVAEKPNLSNPERRPAAWYGCGSD